MKTPKILICSAAALTAFAGVSCEREDIYEPVEFRVTLDPANTYRAGEPVTFRFGGNADFITVWNGDTGHEYRHRERELAPVELFRSAELELKIYQQYGDPGMEIYLTDRFPGLAGRYYDSSDPGADIDRYAEQDRELLRQVVASGFAGWDRFSFTDNTAARFESWKADISKYVDNFTFAIRIKGPAAGRTLRTYFINPRITAEFDRYGTYVRKFSQLTFVPFRMEGLWTDQTPYVASVDADFSSFLKVNQNGIVKFRGQKNPMAGADIAFQGFREGTAVNAASLPGVNYLPVEQWIVMQPFALNTISPDTGENIKGFADDVTSYTHTYDEPGTYTVTFIASTGNYQGESRTVRELTVTVVDPIEG